MAKVLLLNGSPRAHGCTAAALDEMIRIFETEGIETELIQVGNQAIRGCVACGFCKKNGRCVVDCGGVEVECLRLYTVDGRLIKEQTVKTDKLELSLPNAGLYIVELQTRQGLVHKRLVNE